jgi:D-glycero-D-manno-heptose 1,7-bisphosphate phosphatase
LEDKRALFLDRDGVIIEDAHLLTDMQNVKLLPGISKLLKFALDNDLQLFMVTNQTVVARGLITLSGAHELNQEIIGLIEDELGIKNIFTSVYLCPSHPNATLPEFRVDSPMRKPRPGMLLKAKQEYGTNLDNSFMVGDRVTDIIAGNLAGCRTALLEGVMSEKPKIESSLEVGEDLETPDFVGQSLDQILSWIRSSL